MRCLFVIVLFSASSSFIGLAPNGARPQCETLTFQGVPADAWECVRGKLMERGFTISSGESGEIASSLAKADYSFESRNQKLTITIKQQTHRCATAITAITETVDSCRDFEQVTSVTEPVGVRTWRIVSPNVKQPATAYRQITFRRADLVTVKAGGCVQHGGLGKTWALYVDPQKPNATPYFRGQIRLPGMPTMKNLKDFLATGGEYKIPNAVVGDMFLKLGFSDFRYTDNGYWGRKGDDGFDDQCKGIENAWVEVRIVRER